ncbi:NAD(P)/FAD-dependent oxidoreductase [Novosphingobium sp. RD2P27]|uniref:NAD(P)/FAD-dependent oxidoreductase n=1 Tax=Novosphingobium kalidii TaxID=3230299 RepID=A0ABV2D3F7_9SPHN
MDHAQPMVLRGLLYLLTQDPDLAGMKPGTAAKFGTGSEMADAADAAALRAKGAAFLKQYRDSGAPVVDIPSEEILHQSLMLTAGQIIPAADYEIWREETALNRWARGVEWRNGKPPESAKDFMVAVIGSGISGLNTAVQLKRAGIPFVLIEKNPEVGGSWFENRYPGARVDTSSRGYTHLFSFDYPYPYAYCPRDENLKYFKWVADTYGIRPHIAFNTEVKAMTWDDAQKLWRIDADGPLGSSRIECNAVITCVGFLSRPQLPDLEGMDTFAGTSCHTATWPDGFDVKGKRVAVVGSGASGYQTTPVIAKTAAHTYLFQRQPNWCYEDLSYLAELPKEVLWLERNFPYYANFTRFRIAALMNPDLATAAKVDPDYSDPHAVSAANKAVREMCLEFIGRKLGSRPDIMRKMTPAFPPGASRPIRIDSSDSVYDALLRDDVSLVDDKIERITPKGIVAGGVEYELDAIIYATGFKANDYLWPMEVRGRDGMRIQEMWAKDGPRAYLGAMVPNFPNLFMCYGPNSNNFGGFTVVDLLELVAQFALRCIGGLIENDRRSVEVTEEGYWQFASILDAEEKLKIYMDPRANSYYQTQGRSAVNGPIDARRMWRWLTNPAGDPPSEIDDGLRPHFGEDLIVV